METHHESADRRSFLKGAGSASLATLLEPPEVPHSLKRLRTQSQPQEHPILTRPRIPGDPSRSGMRRLTGVSPSIVAQGLPASLSWRDQQGNSFAISFASDMSTFFGYFQRVNEGPIAYRGTRK